MKAPARPLKQAAGLIRQFRTQHPGHSLSSSTMVCTAYRPPVATRADRAPRRNHTARDPVCTGRCRTHLLASPLAVPANPPREGNFSS